MQKGLCATQMLWQLLPICAELGLERVLVTCDIDNSASRKVIENCGGIFESIMDEPEVTMQKRCYWIETF